MSAVLRWLLVGAALCGAAIGASLDEERDASLAMEILEWDLEAEDNGCDNLQEALWTFLTDAGDDSAQKRVDSIVSYANLQKEVAFKSKPYLRQDFRRAELKRKAQILSNPGMALLSEGDVKMGAEFMVAAEQKLRAVSNFSKAFVTTKDESELENLWSEWQEHLKPSDEDSYRGFLKLADQSASLNNERNLEQLWETQSEWMGGYSRAQKLWKEIEPLYLKFHAYVRRRLQKIYPEVPDPIPVHLLGSPEGVDWSGIAQAALLQEEIMKNLESSIAQQSTVQLYKQAQKMSAHMGLPELDRNFWDSSKFKEQCPSEMVAACSDQSVRVVTCNSTPSWPAYLDAHEKIFQGSYYNLAGRANDYIFRHGNRFSGIAAAVSNLGSLLAVANVVDAGLLARDASDPYGQAVNLRMLVALRTLPRLPYLLGVDLCRLRDAPFPPTHPSCWQDRTKMQRVAKPASLADENVYDLFADRAVTSNDPHLSEFAGAILQFQLYEYLAKASGINRRDLFQIGIGKMEINNDFRLLLRAGLSKPWQELLPDINITEVSTAALLKFFKPILPILDDMAAVSEIPDYDLETESPPFQASPSPSPPVNPRARELQTPKPGAPPQAEVTSKGPSVLSTTEGGVGEVESSTEEGSTSGIEGEEQGTSRSTAYIALGGILIGVLIVVASIFIVNRRRKSTSRPEIRKTSNGHIYDPVRRSVGRPASFSPEVAKRLSENGAAPPLPVFSTFRNSLSSPDCESPETIILEETETAAAK